MHVLVIRQDCSRFGTEEVPVPHAKRREDHWQILLKRCLEEVLVHRVRTAQKRLEIIPTDGESDRGTNCRPRAVTTTNPVPKAKHVLRINAERRDCLMVGRQSRKVASNSCGVLEVLEQPRLSCGGVGHCLLRGESLGSNQKQGALRLHKLKYLGDVRRINIRHEVHLQVPFAKWLERLCHHYWPEIASADAKIDHVSDRLAGEALPLSRAHTPNEILHLVKHGIHLRHHVSPVNDNRSTSAIAQRNMEHGALLGKIDLLTREHTLCHVCDLCCLNKLL
mmetsp:Transcript_46688/g.77255  ORF Transcript_46688/g.77255 Transcript_46688/m.77255 type:complete len:279 (-) Transcript_46688:211-1047(-)